MQKDKTDGLFSGKTAYMLSDVDFSFLDHWRSLQQILIQLNFYLVIITGDEGGTITLEPEEADYIFSIGKAEELTV